MWPCRPLPRSRCESSGNSTSKVLQSGVKGVNTVDLKMDLKYLEIIYLTCLKMLEASKSRGTRGQTTGTCAHAEVDRPVVILFLWSFRDISRLPLELELI